jgi:hypothetical protein
MESANCTQCLSCLARPMGELKFKYKNGRQGIKLMLLSLCSSRHAISNSSRFNLVWQVLLTWKGWVLNLHVAAIQTWIRLLFLTWSQLLLRPRNGFNQNWEKDVVRTIQTDVVQTFRWSNHKIRDGCCPDLYSWLLSKPRDNCCPNLEMIVVQP